MGQLLLYEAPGDPLGAPNKVGAQGKMPQLPPPSPLLAILATAEKSI